MSNSASYVKKGGYLLYSTCTLSKKENMGNVKWFCENFDFEQADITENLPDGLKDSILDKGMIELYPSIHGTDGFFISKLKRKGN